MKKGFKKKMSMILIMAMVMSLSMPVSAKENRSAFDETIITEEPGSDSTVIKEELSPDGPEALGAVDIDTERDAVESDADETLPVGWAIYLSDVSTSDESDVPNVSNTYTYSSTNNIVTIKTNCTNNTTYGLEIIVSSYNANNVNAPTLTWEDNSNSNAPVPVTLVWNGNYDKAAAINVIAPENVGDNVIIKAGNNTFVAKGNGAGYVYTDSNTAIVEPSGPYQVYISSKSAPRLRSDDVTIGNGILGLPTLNFNLEEGGNVIATAISSSDVSGGSRIYLDDAWHAEGSGSSLIMSISENGLYMNTLKYKTMESNVEENDENHNPKETVTIDSAGSSSISGTIHNVKSDSYYEVAAFTDGDNTVVENSISVIKTKETDEVASFTITGLASSTSYYACARVVSNDSQSRNWINSNGVLCIPSKWIISAEPYTTAVYVPPVTRYSVIVDQTSLNGSTKYVTGSISTSYSENDSTFTFTGIPEDTEQYTFDGWQYRFANEEETVRHDVEPNEQGKYVIDVKGKRQKLYLYAKWREKVSAVTLRLNDQDVDTISISNEIAKTQNATLTGDCAVVKIELMPQPADTQETLTIEPDGTGFYGMGLTAEDAGKQVFAEEKLSIPNTVPGQDGKQTRTFYVAAAKSGFDDTPMNKWKEEGRRSGAVKLSVKNGTRELSTFTVCINGYDIEAEGYYENGALVKSTAESTESRQVAGKTVNFDTEGVRISGLTVTPATLYLPVGGAAAILKADGSEDDITWNLPEKTGTDELFKSATSTQKDSTNKKACLDIATGAGIGSYTFTALENNFPISSGKVTQNAQTVVSVFGLSGTVTGSATPAFGLKDTVAPGKWSTFLNYSKGTDGTISADSMTLTILDGDVTGAPKTGTITLTSSDEKVVKADPTTLTLTAAGPGMATVTLVYDNTVAAQDAGAKVTLPLEVRVGDPNHTEHHWVLEKKDATWMFDWTGTTAGNGVAKASFRCTVGNEAETLTAETKGEYIVDKKDESLGKCIFTATVTDPAKEKQYTEKCWIKVYRRKLEDGVSWSGWDYIGSECELHHGGLPIEVNEGGFTLEGLQEQYPYTGAPIKPAFNVVDNATGTTLANGTDYSVTLSNNTKVGVATVKVKGKGNYNKSNAEATFKIVNPKDGMDEADLADLKGAKITAVSPKAFDYDGEAHFPETITLKLKGGSEVTYTGTDGENYVDAEGNALPGAVSFSGNVNKGTATVLLSGKNNAKGKAMTVKKTFKINAVDLKAATTEDLTVTVEEETVAWAVKGAQPAVKVEYKGRELLVGQDYKVTYKNNKKVGTASVTIEGKGNYAKTRKDAASFAIEAFDLTGADIIATTAAAGVKVTKVKVTILDKAGDVIPAGKLTVTVEGAAGAKLAAGETVNVKASAKGAELKESCSEEVTVQAGDLSKAKIKVNIKKTYTGEEIELTDDDMKLVTVTVAGATLLYGEDFEIAGYSNNIKKGSMVVKIVGKGEKYSGSKTFKVKIEPKPIGAGK